MYLISSCYVYVAAQSELRISTEACMNKPFKEKGQWLFFRQPLYDNFCLIQHSTWMLALSCFIKVEPLKGRMVFLLAQNGADIWDYLVPEKLTTKLEVSLNQRSSK